MATTGFISALGDEAKASGERRNEEQRALRERKADELEQSIKNMQARAALQPGAPGYLSPDDLKKNLEGAQQQLTGLYQAHEGPQLIKRLKGIFEKKPTPDAQGPQLRPGMTLDDVLAAGGPVPEQPKAGKAIGNPFRDPDSGKWFQMEENEDGSFIRKPLPGYSEETEKQELLRQGLSLEDAEKVIRIKHGLEPKALAVPKGWKYDKETDEYVNQDTQQRVTREQGMSGAYGDLLYQLFSDQAKKHKSDIGEKTEQQQSKFNQSLDRQNHAFGLALQRGDHAAAKRIVNTAKSDLLSAEDRMETMDKNKVDALQGNQQAMLSLVANHIGMTLGAQKGARITRAVWDEAMESAPWFDAKVGKFFHTDENGDHIFDGWKTGVTLTGDQINQMVALGHQRVESLTDHLQRVNDAYEEDLDAGHKPKAKEKPPEKSPNATIPPAAVTGPADDPLGVIPGKNH